MLVIVQYIGPLVTLQGAVHSGEVRESIVELLYIVIIEEGKVAEE